MTSIYLLPLGRADRELVQGLSPALTRAFEVPVDILECEIDLEQFFDPERIQYNSSEIIRFLDDTAGVPVPKRRKGGKLLAVVSEDLFIPILTFVFGEAQLRGGTGVVSYHRLLNERYGLPPDAHLLQSRLEKEAVHELGHAFGLVHCALQDCVMHASTYVEDIDYKGGGFCPLCRVELRQYMAAELHYGSGGVDHPAD